MFLEEGVLGNKKVLLFGRTWVEAFIFMDDFAFCFCLTIVPFVLFDCQKGLRSGWVG